MTVNRNAPAVIFDLDGVTYEDAARKQRFGGYSPQYHHASLFDVPNKRIARYIKVLMDSEIIVGYSTGRPCQYRVETDQWLRHHCLVSQHEILLMRPEDNRIPASQLKVEHCEQIREMGYEIICYIDDDVRNIAALTEAGILALQYGEKVK